MLCAKNILIWLVAVTFCFIGTASAASPKLAESRCDHEVYLVIDCYVDHNGDTWVLCWDYVLEDVVCLEIIDPWRMEEVIDKFFVSQPGGGATGPTR